MKRKLKKTAAELNREGRRKALAEQEFWKQEHYRKEVLLPELTDRDRKSPRQLDTDGE